MKRIENWGLGPMEFSNMFNTFKSGRHILRYRVVIKKKNIVFFSLKINFVFTVCQSTRLGVSGPQRVKLGRVSCMQRQGWGHHKTGSFAPHFKVILNNIRIT